RGTEPAPPKDFPRRARRSTHPRPAETPAAPSAGDQTPAVQSRPLRPHLDLAHSLASLLLSRTAAGVQCALPAAGLAMATVLSGARERNHPVPPAQPLPACRPARYPLAFEGSSVGRAGRAR